eukprot:Lankesteria_metandrocarpae@DN1512_c0_g1_i2.p1
MDLTIIARQIDGLVLCESWFDRSLQPYKFEARQLVAKLGKSEDNSRISVETVDKTFHCKSNGGICYVTLCDRSYPNKMAFSYVEEISKLFQEEMKREWGTYAVDYRSLIETIEKPYYFIKFDRVIQQTRAVFKDPRSSKAVLRLNDNLVEVASIMKKNINDILQRGEHLEDVGRKADDLRFHSKKFAGAARNLSWNASLRMWLPIIVFLLFIFVFIFWRFFL